MPTIEPLRLDVRPYHERKEEPFQAIMESVGTLEPDQAFLLINSFEPTPLFAVMRKKGFEYECTEVGPEEYHILFRRADARSSE